MRVSVIGSGTVTSGDPAYETARTVGRLLGERGHDVVCGGLGGVMEAVCRGATETGSHTVGILPGTDVAAANRYVETPIATGLGNARNVLVVRNGTAVVAVSGATGTLSELGHALDMSRPVAGISTHDIELAGLTPVQDAEAAVDHVEGAVTAD